jgi:hypothetical protein
MKTTEKTNRTKPCRSSATKAAANGGENAAERQARIEAAWIATGKKRLSHSSHAVAQLEKDRRGLQNDLGHDPDGGVEQWQKDRHAVFQALRHDSEGNCPLGVDWRNNAREEPEELRDANFSAYRRASCHFPSNETATPELAREMSQTFPACGWKWCKDKHRLKPEQWGDLLAALEDLKANNIEPTGTELAIYAMNYASFSKQRAMWPAYKHLLAACQKAPAIERMENPTLLFWARRSEWAGAPKFDKPLQIFLNSVFVRGFPAAVAAAILFLLGLAIEGERYANLKHRIETAWSRRGKLNIRKDSRPDAEAMQKVAFEAWLCLGENRAKWDRLPDELKCKIKGKK